jgi:DNA-directed RNA polymerase subunit E'/Rpb7
VVFDRVKELAQKQLEAQAKGDISLRASTEKILGEMIAHEIGHILLNLPSHSAVGLMRGPWDLKDLQDVAYGALLFTPQQAAVVRAEVSRRNSKQETVEMVSLDSLL